METMAYSEDHIALAAEYALGTLDADERAQVETMMSVDKDFAAMVQTWEYRLGVLNQMVGAVEPRPEVWDRIKTEIGLSESQAPLELPPAPPTPTSELTPDQPPAPPHTAPDIVVEPFAVVEAAGPAEPASVMQPAAVSDTSNIIRLSAQARRWRNLATATTAIAAALVAMIAVGVYRPALLPAPLRPKPITRVVEVKTPPAPTLPSAQYVAVLQKDGGSPAFILTVDGATKNFTVRKLGAAAEPGKSFELWLISDRLPRPRSLGVIGGSEFTERPVLAAYDADIIDSATYAVTVEQAGGSPDGNPHSAPVFVGKLIEAVPPAAQAASPTK
jgi:anti-sigma-K factor RskA